MGKLTNVGPPALTFHNPVCNLTVSIVLDADGQPAVALEYDDDACESGRNKVVITPVGENSCSFGEGADLLVRTSEER